MGHEYSVAHASVLASQLPADSRVARSIEPAALWATGDYMLARLVNDFEQFLYAMGKKQGPKPTPITPPGQQSAKKLSTKHKARIDQILGMG